MADVRQENNQRMYLYNVPPRGMHAAGPNIRGTRRLRFGDAHHAAETELPTLLQTSLHGLEYPSLHLVDMAVAWAELDKRPKPPLTMEPIRGRCAETGVTRRACETLITRSCDGDSVSCSLRAAVVVMLD